MITTRAPDGANKLHKLEGVLRDTGGHRGNSGNKRYWGAPSGGAVKTGDTGDTGDIGNTEGSEETGETAEFFLTGGVIMTTTIIITITIPHLSCQAMNIPSLSEA